MRLKRVGAKRACIGGAKKMGIIGYLGMEKNLTPTYHVPRTRYVGFFMTS
jgi:hypothetical protein